jgi:ABC-type lipoprotein export system ATPase subunit
MITEFVLSGFSPYNDQQRLSLMALDRSFPLRTVAIYGAAGSGKSRLLRGHQSYLQPCYQSQYDN